MSDRKNVKGDGHVGENASDRDKVKAERDARRNANKAAKHKSQDKSRNLPQQASAESTSSNSVVAAASELSKETSVPVAVSAAAPATVPTAAPATAPAAQNPTGPTKVNAKTAKAERRKEKLKAEGKAIDAAAGKPASAQAGDVTIKLAALQVTEAVSSQAPPSVGVVEKKSGKEMTKAERRAVQEAQRAAKEAAKAPVKQVKAVAGKAKAPVGSAKDVSDSATTPAIAKKSTVRRSPVKTVPLHRVKLFNHLYANKTKAPENVLNSTTIHPAIIRLGVQYASGVVKGSNARCIAFMNAIKMVIQDYETPSQKEFLRGLEATIKPTMAYLHQCRPLAVSVTTALNFITRQITKLSETRSSETDAEVISQFNVTFPRLIEFIFLVEGTSARLHRHIHSRSNRKGCSGH